MPDLLGRYRLMKLLATGGMGEVFVARQEGPAGFAKTVVVKRVLRHLARDQGFIDLFLNEAQLAAQLQHPYIAQVFGLEREGDCWFIAMEYVHGRSVRDIVDTARAKQLPVPATVAARLASQALQGLHYAHQLTDARGRPLGILHRDVTPDNLLVAFSGVVKLVDFGIARAMTGAVTRVGKPKGKVGYMAPELTQPGARVDGRADVYGVGVVLYELLRLLRPPNAPTTADDATSAVRPPYPGDPTLPPALDDILRTAMALAPDERFATAQAMSEALEAWLSSQGEQVLPGDISSFLQQLYGREVAEANPAVLPLSPSDRAGAGGGVLGGTQPLSALPEEPQFDPVPAAVEVVQELEDPRPRRRGLVLGAGLAALAAGAVALGWLVGWPWARRGVKQPVVDGGVEAAPRGEALRGPDVVVEIDTTVAGSEADASGELLDPGADEGDPGAEDEEELTGEPGAAEGLGPEPRPTESSPASAKTRRKKRVGRVVFKLAAGVEVSYRGRALGVAPLEPMEVRAGVATFVLRSRKSGVSRRVSVRVPAGGTVTLRAEHAGR